MKDDSHSVFMIIFLIAAAGIYHWAQSLSLVTLMIGGLLTGTLLAISGIIYYEHFSKYGRNQKKRKEAVSLIPDPLKTEDKNAVRLGEDLDLGIPIYLPDPIRSRHVHILGATGSGKTESVILNFLRQDIARGLGAIIIDAKGDGSFILDLKKIVPTDKLKIFDLGSENSLTYNPFTAGTPIEAAQRLFAALNWSEEYYKSKAFSAIQKIFQAHFKSHKVNPTLSVIRDYLQTLDSYQGILSISGEHIKQEFSDIAGLRDQIALLTMGHMERLLSPKGESDIRLESAVSDKNVIYFRLQSLISPKLASIVGRLLIGHLGFIAGSMQRNEEKVQRPLLPIIFDEFATFASPEFSDLISKARSAGMALHFAHQSVGDLKAVSDEFLSQITDNSATKIVLRINDPDSSEFFAKAFGTRIYEKVTKRVSNVQDLDQAEASGEGSSREAHQFRAAPDLLKNHPTGIGSVLISHGYDAVKGASDVFRVRFPRI